MNYETETLRPVFEQTLISVLFPLVMGEQTVAEPAPVLPCDLYCWFQGSDLEMQVAMDYFSVNTNGRTTTFSIIEACSGQLL